MSYPGVDPTDLKTMNPVGTQEESVGEPKTAPLQDLSEEKVEAPFAVSNRWKTGSIQFVVECPSGQRCLVKTLDTMDLVNADLLEDMDYFGKALLPSSFDAAGNPVDNQEQQTFWDALKDPDKRLKFFSMLNRLLETAVVNPIVIDDGAEIITDEKTGKRIVVLGGMIDTVNGVEMYTRDGVTRPLGAQEVKTSHIDFSDKMYIFGELNKPLELIRPFRQEDASVASVDTE